MSNVFESGHTKSLEKMNAGWGESRQNEVVSRLLKGEDLQKIMESLPGFSESFKDLDTIDCSDGRVLGGNKIGIAGSGLLLPKEDRQAFIERYRGKIKKVTTHRDCGAAGIAFRNLSIEDVPEGITSADDYGTYCGKKMAEDLGAEHEFLDLPEMANEYHNEVAIVLDQTGRFDSTHLVDFPPHFVCSGAGLGISKEYMAAELKTLAGIALGDHGFGDRFTKEDPLYLIISALSPADLFHWEQVAKEALSDFGDKISFKGFIKPDKLESN